MMAGHFCTWYTENPRRAEPREVATGPAGVGAPSVGGQWGRGTHSLCHSIRAREGLQVHGGPTDGLLGGPTDSLRGRAQAGPPTLQTKCGSRG